MKICTTLYYKLSMFDIFVHRDFVLEQITDYGNCYTFNSVSNRTSSYKSQRSGALYGKNRTFVMTS